MAYSTFSKAPKEKLRLDIEEYETALPIIIRQPLIRYQKHDDYQCISHSSAVI